MNQLAKDLGKIFSTPKSKPATYNLRWPDGTTGLLKKVGRYWVFHHNHTDHGFSHLAWAKSEAAELGATISKIEPRG